MKNVIPYLHQLPQNLLGLIVIACTRAKKRKLHGFDYYETMKKIGISLGKYIIIHPLPSKAELAHEHGHQMQSRYLGWLYLVVIGIPSIVGNVWDTWFHRKWSAAEHVKWYYALPWENWADRLGEVTRNSNSSSTKQ